MQTLLRTILLHSTLALAGLAAAPAIAAGPFDGTWKARPSAAKLDPKPQMFELADGTFTCKTCAPPYTVATDGAFHAIPGHAYADEASARIVDPHVIEFSYRKGGKVTSKVTSTVSDDGKLLTERFEDMSAANGQAVTGIQTARRVGVGKAGSHAFAGSWRYDPESEVSDAGLTFTLSSDGDTIHYAAATGETFDAVMGGPAVPIVGDIGGSMVKIERLGPRSIRETVMREGKTVSISTITLAADGKSMTNMQKDMLHGTSNTMVAVKS